MKLKLNSETTGLTSNNFQSVTTKQSWKFFQPATSPKLSQVHYVHFCINISIAFPLHLLFYCSFETCLRNRKVWRKKRKTCMNSRVEWNIKWHFSSSLKRLVSLYSHFRTIKIYCILPVELDLNANMEKVYISWHLLLFLHEILFLCF